MKRLKRRIVAFFLISLLLLVGSLARPVAHLVRTASRDAGLIEPLPPGRVDDASRLNQTRVADVWEMPLDGERPEQQLAGLLRHAQANDLRVSIAGARHSMGGHTIYPGGLVINMAPWNQMELDAERNILNVQAGALWKDILLYLDQRGLSVSVMQSNHSFTVGGSLSVNCHGWQYDRPPIASTVESFRLMQADGTIVRCSRTENQQLFSLALGGYGLFGIILDAQLRVVPNERYRLEQYIVPIDQSLATFDDKIRNRPGVQMVYARMCVVPDRLFQQAIINAFVQDPNGDIPPLAEPAMAELRRAVFRGSADSEYGKKLRWNAELIDAALKHEGRYYLPYRLHATAEQFHSAYPQAGEFFALKRKFDPGELFQNQFYVKYGGVASSAAPGRPD